MHAWASSQGAGWLGGLAGGLAGGDASGISQGLARTVFCEVGWWSWEMSAQPDSWRLGDGKEGGAEQSSGSDLAMSPRSIIQQQSTSFN